MENRIIDVMEFDEWYETVKNEFGNSVTMTTLLETAEMNNKPEFVDALLDIKNSLKLSQSDFGLIIGLLEKETTISDDTTYEIQRKMFMLYSDKDYHWEKRKL